MMRRALIAVAIIFTSGIASAGEVVRGKDVFPVSIVTNAAGHVLLDFGRHAFGWLEANVSKAGPYVVIWGELIDANGSVVTNRRYTVSEGTIRCACTRAEFSSAGWQRIPYHDADNSVFFKGGSEHAAEVKGFGTVMPFRWAEVVSAPFQISANTIRQVSISYPYDMEEGCFSSSNHELDRICDFCKYSLKATSFTGKFIDGDRERLPYEADSYITQLSTYSAFSDYTLVYATLDHLKKHATWPTEWKQFFIRMCWTDWMYSGRTNFLSECYEMLKTKKLWRQLAREADGLLVSVPSGREDNDSNKPDDIVDWARCYRDGFDFRPVNAVVNSLHYRNLIEMADIARVLGKFDDAAGFVSEAQRVKASFAKVLVDQHRRIVRDGEASEHFTVQANAMALACGVVPPDCVDAVADFIEKKGFSCSTYMAQFVLEALCVAGRMDSALRLITNSGERGWLAMMDKGATITMEFWDLTMTELWRVPDMNHAWSTAPLNIVNRFVLGVTPLEPGFERIAVAPNLGSLRHVKASSPTPKGKVLLEICNAGTGYDVNITVPAETEFMAFGAKKILKPGSHVFRMSR